MGESPTLGKLVGNFGRNGKGGKREGRGEKRREGKREARKKGKMERKRREIVEGEEGNLK